MGTDDLTLLVTKVRNGDQNAYGELVRRFQNMAYGYAYSILGDFHLAEDAVQEAFLDAYQKLTDLQNPEAFPGWFRRIVFKYCDRLTRLKQRTLAMVDESLNAFPLPERFADVVVQMQFVIQRIDPLAQRMRNLGDDRLADKGAELRRRLAGGEDRDGIKAEVFALVREAARRALGGGHSEVQLVAGLMLDAGWVAEIVPGE